MKKARIISYERPEISFDYDIVYSDRKTIAIQVKPDGSVILRAPKRCPWSFIEKFLYEKAEWVEHQRDIMAQRERQAKASGKQPLTEKEIKKLKEDARIYFYETANRFAPQMGVDFGRITIREQKTRWGSCSSQGNLNFNWRLMLAPEPVREYVVVHELAHRKEMNHSKAFYREVKKVMPDYEKRRKWLKNYGITLWQQ